jgi:prevent-host-death family protein
MTIKDYHIVMKKTVRVAELKSRLSEYLRRVRRGETVTVLDRDTPIARLTPLAPGPAALTVRRPAPGAPRPGAVPLPPPLRLKTDVLALLAAERGER